MTAALAQQKTGSAGASRGQEDSCSEMPDPVAVLIRLPDLSEPASNEETPVVAAGSVQLDDLVSPESESTSPPSVAEEPGDQATDAAAPLGDDQADVRATEEEPAHTVTAPWSAFAVPRPVIQLACVLALIVVSFGAYYAIVGGGDGTVDEGNGEIAGDQGSSATVEPAPLTESPEPIEIAAAPPLESSQQQELFVNSPTVDADPNLPSLDVTPDLQDGTEVLTMDAEPSVTLDPQFGEKTDLADSFPVNDSETKDDNLESFGVVPDRGQEEQKRMDTTTQPENGSDAIAPGLNMPQLEQTVDVSSQQYPVTHPSTYQYPEDYHRMFQASPDTRSSQGVSPGPSERTTHDRYPGTARLRPPIEPPPVRR